MGIIVLFCRTGPHSVFENQFGHFADVHSLAWCSQQTTATSHICRAAMLVGVSTPETPSVLPALFHIHKLTDTHDC